MACPESQLQGLGLERSHPIHSYPGHLPVLTGGLKLGVPSVRTGMCVPSQLSVLGGQSGQWEAKTPVIRLVWPRPGAARRLPRQGTHSGESAHGPLLCLRRELPVRAGPCARAGRPSGVA